MAAKAKAPQVKPPRTIAQLEAELVKRTVERDDALARVARLLTETREALEQQTAAAEVLQVINSSPGDLAPVFDVMLEKAMSLCSAIFGELHTYDGVSFKTSATRGHSAAFAEARAKNPPAARRGTASARILETKRPVHILDIKAEESYRERSPASRALIELGGTRTTLAVPLLKNDTVLGFISFHRDEVKPFTDRQIALLQNFAAQAVIAMENARLLTETRERTSDLEESLEYQTATSDVLNVISRSTSDVQPVLDTVMETAARLCGADTANITIREGEVYRHAASTFSAADPEYWAIQRQRRYVPGRDSITGRVALEGRVVHVADVSADPDYAFPEHIAAGLRTALGVPLLREAAVIGTINLNRKRVQPYTERQIELVRTFADQAVIAIENARLITETREALEQQTATAEVLQVINSSPGDLAPVFEAMLENALHLCDAFFGSLWTYDGEYLRPAALRGMSSSYTDFLRTGPHPLGPAQQRLIHGEHVVHFADVPAGEGYRSGDPTTRALVDLGGVRAFLAVALRKEETLLGHFVVYRRDVGPFSDKQIGLLKNFAAQAVIAMENARLLGELRQRTDEVAELNRGLEARVAAQVEELGRVGRLKRFLAPQLAELIVSQGDEKILESHRREIVVVFCDLRGYTAFTETAEPEEVLEFLREYHGALGPLVSQFEGTLDQFSGDGIMVFFNDP